MFHSRLTAGVAGETGQVMPGVVYPVYSPGRGERQTGRGKSFVGFWEIVSSGSFRYTGYLGWL